MIRVLSYQDDRQTLISKLCIAVQRSYLILSTIIVKDEGFIKVKFYLKQDLLCTDRLYQTPFPYSHTLNQKCKDDGSVVCSSKQIKGLGERGGGGMENNGPASVYQSS